MDASLAAIGRWLRRASPLLGLVAFALALWVLRDWLAGQRYDELRVVLSSMPATTLVHAVALTARGRPHRGPR